MLTQHGARSVYVSRKTGDAGRRPTRASRGRPVIEGIVSELHGFATTAKDLASRQEFTVGLIANRLPNYNWVGFYMLDPGDNDVLVLGPFHGAPTDHVRIPVTQGICGATVAQGETVIVQDVSSDPCYLSCSIETKSEIVVPIRVNGRSRERSISTATLSMLSRRTTEGFWKYAWL